MADEPQTAAQDDEQGASIPGQSDDDNPYAGQDVSGGPQGPSQTQTSPSVAPSASTTPPKVSGRAMFLGNLMKTLLSGVQNVQGNPNNAFDRGFAGNSPAANQLREAKVSKALSEADQAKIQTSITGMKALQTEYLLKALPQEQQIKHMEVISKFKDNLIKEGATVEAEGDDEKASDAQAMHLNGTDPRALNHSGRFWSLPTMDEAGKPKFDVVYVPNKDVLQQDFTWNGADGEEHTISAGTPMLGLPKMVEQLQKDVQGDTKELHKQLGDALKPNVPDNEIPQTVGWLEALKKGNSPLYQKNKNAVDAQINTLNAARGKIQADKLAEMRAGAQIKQDELTASTKTMVEAAPKVLNFVDRIDNLIDEQTKSLGPAASRWQEFMAGKVGAPNPEFTKLRTDVGLLTTLLMRMHVGARGGEYIMKHFQDLIDSGKQSPENLKAALGEIKQYAQDLVSEGKPNTNKPDTTPARPKNVPANAVWNAETRQWRLPQ